MKDDHYTRIAGILEKDGLISSNQGLMHGNMGKSIFFYHLARKTRNPGYGKVADDLLDKTISCLSSSISSDFEHGLAGIGWGIEYLIQSNFVKGDPDKILEEVDNRVFRVLNEDLLTNFELTVGLSGYFFYLINRLSNKTAVISMAQRINRELLILTINKIDELATSQFSLIVKEMVFDLAWRFPIMLLGLCEALRLNIHSEKIHCIIKQWTPNIEAYIPSLHINRLYLATILLYMCTLVSSKRLDRQIKILLYATDFKRLTAEIDMDQPNIRFGLAGFIIILNRTIKLLPPDYPNYLLLKSTYHTLIKKYIDFTRNLTVSELTPNSKMSGISEGVAGIGLLSLAIPDLFTSY